MLPLSRRHQATSFRTCKLLLTFTAFMLVLCPTARLQAQTEIRLWPDRVPGIVAAEGPERDTTGDKGRQVQGKRVIRLGNVSVPMLTIYPAPKETNTGTAVIVCPGGGYNILAYDLEGSEVCEYFNSIGVTAALLKYRVPRPKNQDGLDPETKLPIGPLMDSQRAVSLLRSRAEELGLSSDRIGILGFSAGGNLAARTCTQFHNRQYEAIDDADKASCRPDFAVLVYPAYLYRDGDDLLSPAVPVSAKTPPMLLTMAFDDRVGPENILRMGIALKRNNVPAEVHLYPTGGHGYGLRPSEHQATTWPARCTAWLAANGWLEQNAP